MLSASADADSGWSLPRLTSPQALRVVHVVPRLRGGAETEIRRLERDNILAALEATRGQVFGPGGAADLLGVKPTTLASRLKKLRIPQGSLKGS